MSERFDVLEVAATTEIERVERAFDRHLGREVTLVTPGPWFAANATPSGIDRVAREARLMARVDHPAVAYLLDVVVAERIVTMVLAPIRGMLLDHRLRLGPLTWQQVRDLGLQLADGLAAIHAAGVVHRGIGPSSVFVDETGACVLAGFSFAKELDSGDPSSIAHAADGAVPLPRPCYPAPEQAAGRRADARADVYALGCLLYRCLAGAEAGPASGIDRLRLPDVPDALMQAVGRCLAPDLRSRLATMTQVVAELGAVTETAGRRRAGHLLWLVVCLVALAVLLFFLLR